MNTPSQSVLGTLSLVLLVCGSVFASPDGGDDDRSIRSGSVELGISGLLTSVEGTVQAKFGLRGGTFVTAPLGLWGAEGEVSYAHLRSLHQVDLEANVSWTPPVDAEGIFPYLALASGVRIEQLGSFRQTLIPLGVTVGLRVLATESTGLRLDVKIRRMLNDPVQDFTEINFVLGVSLFLHP